MGYQKTALPLLMVFTLSVSGLVEPRCYGWSAGGHRIVANLAFDDLKPAVRNKVVAILKNHPRFTEEFKNQMPDDLAEVDKDRWIFLQASIWPDLIRGISEHNRSTWHYINEPFFLTNQDKAALENELTTNLKRELPANLPDSPVPKTKLNVIQAIKLCLKRLKDENTEEKVKAIYICWLMHLVGDLHQPLHSTGLFSRGRFNTASGDKGGNSIRTQQQGNLHRLWDRLLGRRVSLNDVRGNAAKILQNEEWKQAGQTAAEDLTPETWTKESHEMAKSFTYHKSVLDEVKGKEATPEMPLAKVNLPEDYLKEAGNKARLRIAQAGFRLSGVIQGLFD